MGKKSGWGRYGWVESIRFGQQSWKEEGLERKGECPRFFSLFFSFSLPFISVTVKILPLCFIPSEYGQRVAINYYILLFYLPRRCGLNRVSTLPNFNFYRLSSASFMFVRARNKSIVSFDFSRRRL